MKKILTSILLLLSALNLSAQGVDPILTQLLQENKQTIASAKSNRLKHVAPQAVNGVDTLAIQRRVNVNFHPDGSIRQLCILGTLADGQTCPDSQLQTLGIKTICTVGQLVIMDVPTESFTAISQMSAFKWLAADYVHQLNNDKARKTNNVSYVTEEDHSPIAPGTKYDGSGVIVGVIDQGIDFNHIAFKSNDGKGTTRIKEAITFTSASNEALTTTEATKIAELTTGNTSTSHGTHTSATAAGSYLGEINKQGMAPGADLVLADCSNSLSDAHIIASANAIVKYAKQEGKPCVINVSLGTNCDFHDGYNPIATALNDMSSVPENHCIFAVSAGNEAEDTLSIQKTLNTDDVLKTVMQTHDKFSDTKYADYADGITVCIYSTDGNDFTVEYQAVDVTTGQAYPLSDKPLVDDDGNTVTLDAAVKKNNNNGKYKHFFNRSQSYHFTEENLRLGIFVTAKADNQKFVMISTKSSLIGECHGAEKGYNLTDYTDGDSEMSINAIACTDGVISVGAYMDRDRWTSINGKGCRFSNYYKHGINNIGPYSSYGVDANGIARPDVLAPGTYIVSAYNTYDNNTFSGENINSRTPKDNKIPYITHQLQGEDIGDGQRPYYYGALSGTSQAAPMVTGIIALWLQKDPTLTTTQVRELLRTSSFQDQYTTTASKTPSGNIIQAGCGKIDALRGILTMENATREESNKIALSETFTIPEGRNIATFSSTNALDFRNPDIPKAYIASKFDDNTLVFQRTLDQVPANTGLLITAEVGTYDIPIAPAGNAIETNYLYGTAEKAYTAETEGSIYVLSKQEDQIGFYQNAANLTVPQGKAYLQMPTTTSPSKNRAYSIIFDESQITPPTTTEDIALPVDEYLKGRLVIENTETSVTNLTTPSVILTDIYDLSGRKVTTPHKGMYIMGGKKVLFR